MEFAQLYARAFQRKATIVVTIGEGPLAFLIWTATAGPLACLCPFDADPRH